MVSTASSTHSTHLLVPPTCAHMETNQAMRTMRTAAGHGVMTTAAPMGRCVTTNIRAAPVDGRDGERERDRVGERDRSGCGGVVNLTGRDLHWAVFCVSGLLDRRRVRYEPIPADLVQAHRRLTVAYHTMSASGRPSGPRPTQSEDERIGTTEAGLILGVTARHVRRLTKDLDGIKVGNWTFSRAAVERYAQGRQHK